MPSLTGHIFRPCRGVGFRPVRRRGESSDQGRLVSFTVIQTMALIAGIDTTLWFPSGVGFSWLFENRCLVPLRPSGLCIGIPGLSDTAFGDGSGGERPREVGVGKRAAAPADSSRHMQLEHAAAFAKDASKRIQSKSTHKPEKPRCQALAIHVQRPGVDEAVLRFYGLSLGKP